MPPKSRAPRSDAPGISVALQHVWSGKRQANRCKPAVSRPDLPRHRAAINDNWGMGVRLRRFFLQVLLPLSPRCKAVHHRPVGECALRRRQVLRFAGPNLLRGRLQRPAIAECKPPRTAANPIHGIKVRRRLLVGLAAGQKGNRRDGSRHACLEYFHSLARRPPRQKNVLSPSCLARPCWV
jgi:hypothetical protein